MLQSQITRFDWVDALRGYAILLVILIHTSEFFKAGSFSLGWVARNGAYGVTLFFIASSFTLFNSYNTRISKVGKNAVLFFMIRRFFRIAPMYYLVGLLSIFIALTVKSYWISEPINYLKILVNYLFLNGIFLSALNYIPLGGWSIGVEMIFYLTIPTLFAKIKNLKQAVFLLISSILVSSLIQILLYLAIGKNPSYSWSSLQQSVFYAWFPNQFPIFCFGIVLYFLVKSEVKLSQWFIAVAILLIVMSRLFEFRQDFPYSLVRKEYLMALVFGIFAYFLSKTKRQIFIKPFTGIGRVSFSAYLLHFFVAEWIASIFHSVFGPGISPDVNLLIAWVLTVSATFLIAYQTYQIEKMGIKLGENLISRLIRNPKTN